jgi:hypothetical protein
MKRKLSVLIIGAWLLGASCNRHNHGAASAKENLTKILLVATKPTQLDQNAMLVRTNADGTRVFRQIGMYVLIAPTGEKRFLPDEI